jgi:uncharacterized coiled-coil DUF342 family protein
MENRTTQDVINYLHDHNQHWAVEIVSDLVYRVEDFEEQLEEEEAAQELVKEIEDLEKKLSNMEERVFPVENLHDEQKVEILLEMYNNLSIFELEKLRPC